MGGRARISPPSLWVREDDGEIREGLLFPALVARHAKRFNSTGQGPLTLATAARTPEHCPGCSTIGRALKALLWGGSRAPGGGNRGVVR
jgi:hypothetical protein